MMTGLTWQARLLATRLMAAVTFTVSMTLYATQAPAPVFAPEETPAEAVAQGQRIYREGILPSGKPVRALVQKDVPLSGMQVTCVSCHRRSGLSFSESGRFVPPIAGRFLYAPKEVQRKELWASRTEGPGTRPAYTDETLMRAIRQGIDASGHPLDHLMPRYQLSDSEMAPLIAYLKTLSTGLPPGITEDTMHFATIVSDGVDPGRSQAMLDVLNTYFHDKNNETRHETGRSRRAPWHKDWVYQAYRKWELHVWELNGPEDSWSEQLEAYYRRQPVFVALSGIVDGSWQPIHDFCEGREVPCLFPITALPVINEQDFYSIYFSRGLTLEAEALASHLADTPEMKPIRVVQIWRNTSQGRTAADAFRRALQRVAANVDLVDRKLSDPGLGEGTFWQNIMEQDRPDILVLWVNAKDLKSPGLEDLEEVGREVQAVYFSAELLGVHDNNLTALPADLRQKALLAFPYALPETQKQLLVRPRAWLRSKGIAVSNERIQADTHFTVMLLGATIKRIIDNFSREYLIERIEHRVDSALTSSIYPRVTLAPAQRFVSKGCYVVQWPTETNPDLVPVSDWIIP
jgi:mono/diheme cytochrome c family protein